MKNLNHIALDKVNQFALWIKLSYKEFSFINNLKKITDKTTRKYIKVKHKISLVARMFGLPNQKMV